MNDGAAPTRPVLRWHGGKWRLADWLVARFPPHRVYVEPFAGAASVLLRKPPAAVEVLNDRHRRLVNLFRLLRDPDQAARLADLVRLTPYAEIEYRAGREPAADPLEDARRLRVLSWQSHGSNGASGTGTGRARLTGWRRGDRGGHSNSAREWATLWAQVVAWADRRRGVFIECADALAVIRRWDGPDVLFYCDPPYPRATRTARNGGYAHEFSDADHAALAAALHGIRGMAVVSGYPCPLYEALYGDWSRRAKRTLADAGAWRTEALWLNPAAARRLRQPSLWETAP